MTKRNNLTITLILVLGFGAGFIANRLLATPTADAKEAPEAQKHAPAKTEAKHALYEYVVVSGSNPPELTRFINQYAEDGFEVVNMSMSPAQGISGIAYGAVLKRPVK